MNNKEKFFERLSVCREVVGYLPFKHEPSYSFLPLAPTVVLPANTSADPLELGDKLARQFADTKVCVYIPGTTFDRYGTRHGRGGGWYDRFLATVPSDWMRVGICLESSFSLVPLRREMWDQPVDWVCVEMQDKIDYYETHARNSI